ncbi:MAG TPA: spermidine synthase [Candidatus Limnocylindria bacterium]|nr:spermidine synthase [Candidatus Limnocylindria bacterium]
MRRAGASDEIRLVLTSATILFVELLLIRWIPANIIYVGFFNNFVLMASFLGIGCGILLGRRFGDGRPAVFPLLLFALVALVYSGQLNARLPTAGEVFIGTGGRDLVEVNVLVLAPVIVLATAVMAALALPLGALLRSMPPLRAYAFDISGSLIGIALFVSLAAVGTPPLVWFAVAAILWTLLVWAAGQLGRRAVVGLATLAMILFLGIVDVRHGDQWSPYYRVTMTTEDGTIEAVYVNGIPFQTLWPADSPEKSPVFDQVYRWFPERSFRNVLVVGAGTGTDTAVALRHGVGSVDAVEIDPLMLQIGVERHPDRPYQDPRVRRTTNDGRAFLRTTDARYDLIVFAQTDSFALVGTTANLRLESFLFTQDAFDSARDHLTADGVFVLYNVYRERWLVDRYAGMLAASFGSPPIVRSYPRFAEVNVSVLADGPAVAALRTPPADAEKVDLGAAPAAATDDWPFPDLRERGIPARYLIALGMMVAFALLAVGSSLAATRAAARRFSPHFFALGAAFLLLETRSLVTFGLLFGTTWIVNALVFFAILASVLAAVALNARFRFRDPRPLYALLFLALAVGYVVHPASLLLEPAWLRYALAATLAFAPVLFANLVFTRSFADTRTADMAFASNLIGAMVGGVIEWIALMTGYQQLLLVVTALYLAAFALASRWRVLADRELELLPEAAG